MNFLFGHRRTTQSLRGGFSLLEMLVVVAVLVVTAGILLVKIESIRSNADDTAATATLNTVREALMGSPAAPGYLSDMKNVPGFDIAAIQMRDLLDKTHYPTAQCFDVISRRGWNGPYLNNVQLVQNTNASSNGLFPGPDDQRFINDKTFFQRNFYTDDNATGSPYGSPGQPAIADQWGNPLVLQIPPASAFTTPTDAKRFRYARLVSAGKDGTLNAPLDRLAGMLSTGNKDARGDDVVIFLNRADIYEVEEP